MEHFSVDITDFEPIDNEKKQSLKSKICFIFCFLIIFLIIYLFFHGVYMRTKN